MKPIITLHPDSASLAGLVTFAYNAPGVHLSRVAAWYKTPSRKITVHPNVPVMLRIQLANVIDFCPSEKAAREAAAAQWDLLVAHVIPHLPTVPEGYAIVAAAEHPNPSEEPKQPANAALAAAGWHRPRRDSKEEIATDRRAGGYDDRRLFFNLPSGWRVTAEKIRWAAAADE